MKYPNSEAYVGDKEEGGFSNFIAENNFFVVIEIEAGISHDQGDEIIRKIKAEIAVVTISDLSSLDQFISQLITKYNLPSSFSLAVGYVKENVLYLKTAGQGKVYLKRGSNFAQIIEMDNSASGYIENEDYYIFTS